MLSGEDNENGEKNNNRSNQQKSNFAPAAHFFCTFLCRCFARLQRETSRSFLVTHFMEEMSYFFLFTFFSTVAHFHPAGCQHFLFSHCCYKISCCSSTKKCLLWFFSISLYLFFLIELCWPVALLSVSLFSKFFDMTIINLNLILQTTGYRNNFCFLFSSLLTLQLSLLNKTWVAIRFPSKIT